MSILRDADVENAVISISGHDSVGNIPSALWSTHMAELHHDPSQAEAFAITAHYILEVLSQEFHGSGMLLSNLGIVGQKVKNHAISTIRRLELEVLQAGKVSKQSNVTLPHILFLPIPTPIDEDVHQLFGKSPQDEESQAAKSIPFSFSCFAMT